MVSLMLIEATAEEENGINLDNICKSIKKLMQTAKLTKFRSVTACQKVHAAMFLCALEESYDLTVSQWTTVYIKLLSDDPFCSDLAIMMVCWQPLFYTGLFAPLWAKVESELIAMKENRIRYLSMVKGALITMQSRYAGIAELIKTQVRDGNVMQYITVIDQTLNQYQSNITAMIQVELTRAVKPDDVVYQNTMYVPIGEAWTEVLRLLENGERMINEQVEREMEFMDESVIQNAAMKAKELNVVRHRKEKDFDNFITHKIQTIRENRQNRRHEEMVGETINVSHRIKSMLKLLGAAFIAGPVVGAIVTIAQIAYNRATSFKDRQALIADLQDELEIIEEKIATADRNQDDKAKVELIRARQKLQRELARINKVQYTEKAKMQLKAAKNS